MASAGCGGYKPTKQEIKKGQERIKNELQDNVQKIIDKFGIVAAAALFDVIADYTELVSYEKTVYHGKQFTDYRDSWFTMRFKAENFGGGNMRVESYAVGFDDKGTYQEKWVELYNFENLKIDVGNK